MNAKSHITTFKWRHINAFPVHLSSNNSLEQCAVHAHEIVFFSREAWTVLPWRAFWIGVLNQRFKTLILPSQNKHERSLTWHNSKQFWIPECYLFSWRHIKQNKIQSTLPNSNSHKSNNRLSWSSLQVLLSLFSVFDASQIFCTSKLLLKSKWIQLRQSLLYYHTTMLS